MKKICRKRIYLYSEDRFRFWISINYEPARLEPMKAFLCKVEKTCSFCGRKIIEGKKFYKQNGSKYCSQECHIDERNATIVIRIARKESKKIRHTNSNYQYGNKITHFEFNLDNLPRKIRERI